MPENILQTIAENRKKQIDALKISCPLDKETLKNRPVPPDFYDALAKEKLSYICECKKASPSKGLICPDFDPVSLAKQYEQAGASAISVLSEPSYFLGSDEYVRQVAQAVSIPVLRKDFVLDEYMILQAAELGASAILLIVALLSFEQLQSYIALCHELHLSALVEAHDEQEVKTAIAAGARVLGVNNRNLKDFSVDMNNSIRLRNLAGPEILFVSESGIKNNKDIQKLKDNHMDAVLIGETLVRSYNIAQTLFELNGEPL
jgi:indole-3-glycerol phosphate synthase